MNPVSSTSARALLIIVTYRSHDVLPDIAASIREFVADRENNHVVVVENSADARVKDHIRTSVDSDRVLVEVAARNEGFSHGVNFAYGLANRQWGHFDWIVLLNPDVESAGRVVCTLVNRAIEQSDAAVGVWGAVLRDQQGDIDRGCARRVWNGRRFFSHLVGYHDLVKYLGTTPRSLDQYEIDNNQSELAMVSGALMCIRSDVFGEGLDTRLPMYLEDQEVCLRSLSQGLAVKLHSDLELVHVGAASRRSVTTHERALRVMELVEAPVQCMVEVQGFGLTTTRLTVLLGGIVRFVLAAMVAMARSVARKAPVREEFRWMVSQQRLARWFVVWALRGHFHRQDISLDAYFDEYSKDG